MKFSVVIPTHDPRYLRDAVDSVSAQTVDDIEILIVPNGHGVGSVRHMGEWEDKRVRVVEHPSGADGTGSIGKLKRFAFWQATGDVLVELDHDDLLMPHCLERIGAAVTKGADFVYSNFAEFHDHSWKPNTYGDGFGWKYRPLKAMGHDLVETIAFDPTPAALGRVWWAPNHVRAWTRSGYEKSGGHNAHLGVCDDHDLVVRSYLAGLEFHRVDECLYLYRVRDGQTSKERNAEIQRLTQKIYADRIEALVLEWARREGLPCYDLGGGHNSPDGWTPVDISGAAALRADLRQRWPWEESTVGAFRAYDFLEHLPNKQHTVDEIFRCLAPGGWLLSLTPSALGQGGFMDPTHVSHWVKNSWLYYTDRQWAKYIGTSVRFQNQRLVSDFPSDWHREENIPYITFDGVALKPGYEGPGEVRI